MTHYDYTIIRNYSTPMAILYIKEARPMHSGNYSCYHTADGATYSQDGLVEVQGINWIIKSYIIISFTPFILRNQNVYIAV